MCDAGEQTCRCHPLKMLPLLDFLCEQLGCPSDKLIKELGYRLEHVEGMLRHVTMYAVWKEHCYPVYFQSLSKRAADTTLCTTHHVPIDVDYKENLGVELKHPELPCVVSADVDFVPILYPIELVYLNIEE